MRVLAVPCGLGRTKLGRNAIRPSGRTREKREKRISGLSLSKLRQLVIDFCPGSIRVGGDDNDTVGSQRTINLDFTPFRDLIPFFLEFFFYDFSGFQIHRNFKIRNGDLSSSTGECDEDIGIYWNLISIYINCHLMI